MNKRLLVSAAFVAASILLSGCTNATNDAALPKDAPLVSSAQGLGEPKFKEGVYGVTQFEQVYDSTNGAVSFKTMDAFDWEVKRVLKAPEGETLPAGDNFEATASNNFAASDTVKAWVDELEKDGWNVSNEVKAEPREDEKQFEGTKEDYRVKPYSADLTKGKSTINVNIKDEKIVVKINSQ